MKVVNVTSGRKFFKQFLQNFSASGSTDLAAQLAYYFFLSLFPLLLFLLTLIAFLPVDAGSVLGFLRQHAPGDTGSLVADQVKTVVSQPQGSLMSIGIIATLWSASGGVSALMRALNRAYGIEESRSFIKAKGLAIGLTIGVIFVIVVTLALPVFGQLILKAIGSVIHLSAPIMVFYNFARWLAGIVIMIFVMMLLYRFAPDEKFRFGEVVWGALFTTVAWQLISLGFSFYISNFANYSATYGALGGIIIMLLWFYLTGLILVAGGQINATLYQMKNPPSDLTR